MTANQTSQNSGYYITRIFQQKESVGGILLILATLTAILLANSAWGNNYFEFLEKKFEFLFDQSYSFKLSLKDWVNDGLMVIFFLVAGLELKREIMVGELSSRRKASAPLLAALGGMLVPALIYFLFNHGKPGANGWGIPMATDIAYSLGILSLLGRRVPIELKIFLTALAIADDLGAILIIALFYSSGIIWWQLGLAGGIFILLFIFNITGVKGLLVYILFGIPFWFLFLHSGLHPTIAGVLFALTIPIRSKLSSKSLEKETEKEVAMIRKNEEKHILTEEKQRTALKNVKSVVEKSIPPLYRLEIALSGLNAYSVIPLFALVNAGVVLNIKLMTLIGHPIGLGVMVGLIAGKVIGISLFTYLGIRMGITQLPPSLNWPHIIGLGLIAGIGFTMSLFITNLAFENAGAIQIAKIGILLASLIAAISGVVMLSLTKKKPIEDNLQA